METTLFGKKKIIMFDSRDDKIIKKCMFNITVGIDIKVILTGYNKYKSLRKISYFKPHLGLFSQYLYSIN